MPQVADRNQLRSEELPELPLTGPFGGVQSEIPLTGIERIGFADVKNLIFRLGRADSRPSYTQIAVPSSESIEGIADFYNAGGTHIQVIFTPTRMYQYTSSGFVEVTGPGLHGTAGQPYAWDVIGNKLCFSQGVDQVMQWDGVATGYSLTSASAPVASILAEVGGHLMAVNPALPSTYQWSGLNDPTDWTSFSAGTNNYFNNLGPIHQIVKIGQYGFGFYHQGIVQIIPTGIGTAPFAFYGIVNASQGTIAPNSVDHFDDQGVEYAAYLGFDNVYVFNGTSVDTIGDRPMGDGRRFGARSRILADVKTVDPHTIRAFITYSIAGNVFRAYWLAIPGVSMWVYNFDEGNWTVFNYADTISSLGAFYEGSPVRIMDLVGRIQDQSWTPGGLATDTHFPGFLIGFSQGYGGYVDFTNFSEQPVSAKSGKLIFGDRRHRHTVKNFRLVVQDQGPCSYTITLTNENGYSQTQQATIGTGSGDDLSYIFNFSVTGLRLEYSVAIPATQPGSIIEFAPYYDTSGEQRGGTLEN